MRHVFNKLLIGITYSPAQTKLMKQYSFRSGKAHKRSQKCKTILLTSLMTILHARNTYKTYIRLQHPTSDADSSSSSFLLAGHVNF